MVCYAGATGEWIALALSGVGLVMLITADVILFVMYKKEIVNDPMFAKWLRMYPKTEKYLSLLALLINFKSIKFLYSGIYRQESCLA